MLNTKLIYKVIGALLFLEVLFLILCLAMSIYHQEDDSLAFAISIVVTIMGGIVFRYLGRSANNNLNRKDSYLLVTLTWVMFSLFGSLPFLVSGYITNPTDAFFETMSGFTSTGASVIDDVEQLPHGLLFWRSMTQWIGGLGIVFFTIAVIPSFVGGNIKVFDAETTGPIRTKMHPRLSTNAKWIWSTYLLLTVGCGVCFYLFGMDAFDSMNYAMTVAGTGGFATHNESTSFFNNAGIDFTAIGFMFLSGTSYTLLYGALFKGKVLQMLRNAEFKLYLFLIVAFTAFIMWALMVYNGYSLSSAFRIGLFQVVSFISSTGIFNDNAALWPHATWVILGICMLVGACSGSTSGGLKCVRGVLMLKILRNELKRILHPRAVLPVKLNQTNVPYASQVTLMAFLAMYLLLCLFTFFVMTLVGIDSTNAIVIALSCASNVGPSLDVEIGSPMSWAMLPDAIKWLLAGLMLVGRLEIFNVVVLFTAAFWKDN